MQNMTTYTVTVTLKFRYSETAVIRVVLCHSTAGRMRVLTETVQNLTGLTGFRTYQHVQVGHGSLAHSRHGEEKNSVI